MMRCLYIIFLNIFIGCSYLAHAQQPLLYGLTSMGGLNNRGVIFRFNVADTSYVVLHDFELATGAHPQGSLVQAPDGKLYGMCLTGGTNPIGGGVIFSYNPVTADYNVEVELHDSLGANPNGNLCLAPNGKFYGLIAGGGAFNHGVLFEYDYNFQTFTVKYHFDGVANGGIPVGSLAAMPDGKLYGFTTIGGAFNGGIIFEFDTGTDLFTVKHEFTSQLSGINPYGTPVKCTNGKLYGTAVWGGLGVGTVFGFDLLSFNPANYHSFDIIDGSLPFGDPAEGSNGKLFGMTNKGGLSDKGILYELDPNTSLYDDIFDFDSTNLGGRPKGSLLQASNGKMYGLTSVGGPNGGGSLYSFEYLSPYIISILYYFDCLTGCNPVFTTLVEYDYLFTADKNQNVELKPRVFPNPSQGLLRISGLQSSAEVLEITDAQGAFVFRTKVDGMETYDL